MKALKNEGFDREFQHTAARRRLPSNFGRNVCSMRGFQHTAARRRLLPTELDGLLLPARFNTQPPEGGCAP